MPLPNHPLTTDDLQQIAQIATLPETSVLIKLIERRLSESDRDMRGASGEDVFRCQGRSQALAALIEDITQARTRLNRSAETQRPRRVFHGEGLPQ